MAAEGPEALADTLVGGFKQVAFRSFGDDPCAVVEVLRRNLDRVLQHDTGVIDDALRRAIDRLRPTDEVFHVWLVAYQMCLSVDARASALANAYVELTWHLECRNGLVNHLVRATDRAIRGADYKLAVIERMLEALCHALPSGPSVPDWMMP